MTYCGHCWNRVGPHRSGKLGPGGIPHEKTDQAIADKLRATLEACSDDLEQQELFRMDENTAWFGVVKDESEDSIFYDYGRYADIMTEISQVTNPRQRQGAQHNRFPGLVSFVGETGAGKSTLVKVLIELSESGEGFQTPIVGSNKHQDVPTSGDVHLYTDPETYLSETPIFYADCEGLAGGEREPKGARSKLLNRMAGNNKGAQRSHTTKSFEQSLVFVLKNPRVIENVIEKLIEWAAAALEMSSNQPVLPHAVIALNASELNIDQEQWDTKISTSWLMNSVQSSLTSNVLFKKHTQIWRNRGRQINTVEDLLLSYYSTVTVVRIPANGRPKLMKDQVEKLYGQIMKSTEAARKSKRDLRMLLDGGELQTYLQFAFDHFSSNLDQAFDFVQASFIYNPIPSDFAGNILKLAVGMMERWEHELDGKAIFTELSHMVASCIMLDSARNKTRGSAELIFPEYVDSCDNALEDFCDRYWPCEYVMKVKTKRGKEVGGRCVNVRSGHGSKGHQFKNGKVIAVGNYESSFSAESFQEVFRYLVTSRGAKKN
ncbi:hypothetical protein M7I_7298 [Glarea lozoyensis 74030]|uniref:P-loop containing nucleoside triphosphate hydrolase n=1 Tax=Glarea lozoyensis (strain ATCC 74030 / MF5533) TaxID=1104152 RepID=H0EWX3_GLAL7|nr:hypothetical protein M7I_7298 [Glarea lozoyensis 74030]